MTFHNSDSFDAAAFVYIRSCLMGRAHRFRERQLIQVKREPAILNEPLRQSENSADRLSLITASDPHYDPNRIADSVTLQGAMQCLTPNELRIIEALFFEGEKVIRLCETLHVSKNTVLKTKRNALRKLRRALQQLQ
ncbi:sigma-70 family RNA polymerase sigma factor [Alicyclobacillus sp. SO9]|uniref:sigma-70 family RNA polymerase sigma factor n=1 Tax=Alicyclobacillus sp. SO9 TaxID=2665646 RepID=UPI0018E6DDBC|nr:sigma-70 family RNA polymerase sigma factor [Alicyclobacillus sp. SO9]QQE80053.1 sigma-70 family RNA polymerase sigma factor [Alicyclobacillus sp. SO9]